MKKNSLFLVLLFCIMISGCNSSLADDKTNNIVSQQSDFSDEDDEFFETIPNSAWKFKNIEDVHKQIVVQSNNQLFFNDGIGNRFALLTIVRQKSKPYIYPSIIWISKEEIQSCEHENCIIKIIFDGDKIIKYNVLITEKNLVKVIYILDENFEKDLENHSYMKIDVSSLNLNLNYLEFKVYGFKSHVLNFD